MQGKKQRRHSVIKKKEKENKINVGLSESNKPNNNKISQLGNDQTNTPILTQTT